MAEAAIPHELNEMLEQHAQEIGSSKDHIVREAILRHFDDLEDIRIVTKRLKNPGKRISLEKLKQKHTLED